MNPIEFHPDAAQEANDAVDYYDQILAGLGEDFRVDVAQALERIQHNPALYGIEAGNIRVCPLHRFPYCIYYVDFPDRIWVAAVGHQHRLPGYWSRRQP